MVLKLGLIGLLPLTTFGASSQGDERTGSAETLEAARKSKKLSRLVSIEVRPAKPEARFAVLEPIKLKVVARNISDHSAMVVDWGGGKYEEECHRTYQLKVFDANGLLVRRARYGESDVKYRGSRVGGGVSGSCLNPGKQLSGDLIANLIFDMTSPGDYTVLVEVRCYPTEAYLYDERPLIAQSEPIAVKVLDRLP
jgi:hypothetical protein